MAKKEEEKPFLDGHVDIKYTYHSFDEIPASIFDAETLIQGYEYFEPETRGTVSSPPVTATLKPTAVP